MRLISFHAPNGPRLGVVVAHCSQAFTLEPGDVEGDVVSVAIEGIGELRNTCRIDHPPGRGM